MKHIRFSALLMGLTILGITGFQLYWLKDNYDREKNNLAMRANILFQETVQHLQVMKLKLEGVPLDSLKEGGKRIMIKEPGKGAVRINVMPRKEIAATIDVVKTRLRDSLKKNPETNNAMVISMNRSSMIARRDSLPRSSGVGGDHFFQVLYGIDSLQDSLKVCEIDSAYHRAVDQEGLNVPFTITRSGSSGAFPEPELNRVTVGFVNPVSYELELGNSVSYLLDKIKLPILFSIVLLGITLLSFILLYRNLERQRRLSAVKNEFISNITHELKTPIATVAVAIEALKNFNAIDDPAKTREYLNISSNELQRLGLLVDKVLKLSLFETQAIQLKMESIDLKQLAEDVVSSLRLQIDKNHASVFVRSTGDTVISGDRLHLQSVVFNLLDNAFKYSKTDPIINITLDGGENEVVMEVRDNGMGIPPEYTSKVFEKFFRVPHGDTHNAKGYGLGLSYAAHVVEKHKGTITLESEPGRGSKFIVTLPRA